jgi:hypothetical protein
VIKTTCTGRLLDTDLPWMRLRCVCALIGMARAYGSGPVGEACAATMELAVISDPG